MASASLHDKNNADKSDNKYIDITIFKADSVAWSALNIDLETEKLST